MPITQTNRRGDAVGKPDYPITTPSPPNRIARPIINQPAGAGDAIGEIAICFEELLSDCIAPTGVILIYSENHLPM